MLVLFTSKLLYIIEIGTTTGKEKLQEELLFQFLPCPHIYIYIYVKSFVFFNQRENIIKVNVKNYNFS